MWARELGFRWWIIAAASLLLSAACAAGGFTEDDDGLSCGDGLLDQSNGEECDDGNRQSGDGCSIDCIIEGGGSGSAAGGASSAANGAGGASGTTTGTAATGSAQASTGTGQSSGGGTLTETICDDQIDNDNDNAIDCKDSDCDGQSCGANGLLCQGGSCVCPGGTSESQCTDSADNDCDGDTDCDDSDCASDAACATAICPSPGVLTCSSTNVSGTTVGGPTNISSVGCNAVGNPGPEAYYTLTLASSKAVKINLKGSGVLDQDLAVVGASGNDCDPQSQCLEWAWGGTNEEEVNFTATANTTYYIIVDTYVTIGNSFTITVTCT